MQNNSNIRVAEIPYGCCYCGCGRLTPIARKTNKRWGWEKGKPKRFIHGHSGNRDMDDMLATRWGKIAPDVRFWSHVDKSGGPDACWPWVAFRDSNGYGHLTWQGKTGLAHRKAYELTYGPFPGHLKVCHRCDNPPCCNPAHHFLGTMADNTADMIAKGRMAVGERRWNFKRK